MATPLNSAFMAGFQQIFAPFCVLLAEICTFLFFHISASKFQKLLITAYDVDTNRIQREFDSNVAIATQEFSLASKHLRQKTNLLKPFSAPLLLLPLRSGGGVLSLRAAERRLGWGILRAADTNQIQREFLFNNGIQSQSTLPASSSLRKKTNLYKLFCAFVPLPEFGVGVRGGVKSRID
jgi:hypothetical protein